MKMTTKKKFSGLITATLITAAGVSGPLVAGSGHSGHHGGQQAFIDKFDKNSDGKVTKKEFTKARKKTYKLTDDNNSGGVNKEEYVQEYANRLDTKIETERKAHVKQTHIRFGSLDKNEDQQLEWAEYQASGERSFKRYDTNGDNAINGKDEAPQNRWESTPNGVKSGAKPDSKKETKKDLKRSEKERKEMRKKYANRVIHMPTTHNKKGMLKKYDTNEDGSASYEEFSAKRRIDFDRADENNDTWLNEDEYLLEYSNRLDANIESMRKKQIKQAAVRFSVLDSNDNANITFLEYQLSGDKRFNRYDRNEDGAVSVKDPEPESHHHSMKKKGPHKGQNKKRNAKTCR